MIYDISESEVAQSCLTLCDTMDCSLSGFSIHGIFQARVLEWVAISFSSGSSWPRDQTWVSCIAGRHFTHWATREAPGTYDIVSAYIFKALRPDEILFASSYSITQVFNIKMLQGPIFDPLLFFAYTHSFLVQNEARQRLTEFCQENTVS